jgi:hypothetical protein
MYMNFSIYKYNMFTRYKIYCSASVGEGGMRAEENTKE